MSLPPYIILEKAVGETPLSCAEAWRAGKPEFTGISLAYAGRLDPLASGKLLVLIGDECKVQEQYHAFDKEYKFSILFGVGTDTSDVMGRLTYADTVPAITTENLLPALETFTGTVSLPFPIFSARTVQGKPLHTWAVEGRLHEIAIPVQTSTVYSLTLTSLETKTRTEVYTEALAKVNSIPPVTELRKAIGNDFRRVDIRADWEAWLAKGAKTDTFTIAHLTCIASSGTYMRSLAEAIGQKLHTNSLAYHIHRTEIGTYNPATNTWTKKF